MKLFKNYKKLYLNELENRKMLINQVSKLGAENVDYQKEIQCYKEKCGKLSIELEDEVIEKMDNLPKNYRYNNPPFAPEWD
jgi:heterodisulfide reductase subunit B